MKNNTRGFTIVELLIVIVVIAILAAITVVAYNGIQAKGRDAQRRSDVASIAKALKLYQVQSGNFFEAGSGCASNGTGYFNLENGSTYPTSMNNCMKNAGLISKDIVDPSGSLSCTGLSCYTYLKYTCTLSGDKVTYVYAHLETLPQLSTDTDNTCADIDASHGMNYFVKVN